MPLEHTVPTRRITARRPGSRFSVPRPVDKLGRAVRWSLVIIWLLIIAALNPAASSLTNVTNNSRSTAVRSAGPVLRRLSVWSTSGPQATDPLLAKPGQDVQHCRWPGTKRRKRPCSSSRVQVRWCRFRVSANLLPPNPVARARTCSSSQAWGGSGWPGPCSAPHGLLRSRDCRRGRSRASNNARLRRG
jgi:hypothetical protein